MYLVLISFIFKHFLCPEHGNLVFPWEYPGTATLLADYWGNPVNQVGTYTGTLTGTNGTTCLLRHHTYTLHTSFANSCNWYIDSKGYTYYSLYQIDMADGGDPPRHGGAGVEGRVGTHQQPQLLNFHSS